MRLQASAILLFAGVLLYFAGAYAAANPEPNRRAPDHSTAAMLFSALLMMLGTVGVVRSMWLDAVPAGERKPFQFGLGSLMTLILIASLFFGYVAFVNRAETVRKTIPPPPHLHDHAHEYAQEHAPGH